MADVLKDKLAKIELLVLDVDGVLTDGTIIIHGDGSETKSFHTLDGHGIRLWQRAGGRTALLSGRMSDPTAIRAAALDIEHVFQNMHHKLPKMQEFLAEIGLEPDRVAYVGDDLPDLPVMRYVGLGVAVADAVPEVRRYADYVTAHPGGRGAVREVIEMLLRASGRWDALMERYLT
ncbi:MAG TPA: phenylphosphate carboxylase subunit delta [Phycisphaerales bacterium]|nr:phenylphosphate carboxylase subunit delta [Phycisphaerales bacterium]